MTFVAWIVLGVGCFNVGTAWVFRQWGDSVQGAFILGLLFCVGAVILIGIVFALRRREGEDFTALGLRTKAGTKVWIIAIIFGLLWASMTYLRGADPFEWTWQRPIMMLLGPVLAFGEEITFRGFILNRLHRANVSKWIQVLFTGLTMATYHSFIAWTFFPEAFIFSAIVFSVLSILYIAGNRTLLPPLVAHSLVHVLGDPELMRGILVVLTLVH